MAHHDVDDPRVGTVVGNRWKIDELIGAGGNARVYAATDLQSTHWKPRRVAIKMLHAAVSEDPEAVELFMREGEVGNLVGDGTVLVKHYRRIPPPDAQFFMVMDLLEGDDLHTLRLKSPGKRMAAANVVDAMEQSLRTLARAHRAGIIHRDLKTPNLFRTSHGDVKILDWGLALMDGKPVLNQGDFWGSPGFVPPEQGKADWKKVDERSDLWSLGAVAKNLLTGELPYPVYEDDGAVYGGFTVPCPIESVAGLPGVSDELARVIDKSLACSKKNRYQSADAMLSDLKHVPEHVQGMMALQMTTQSERKWAPAILGGAFLGGLALFFAFDRTRAEAL